MDLTPEEKVKGFIQSTMEKLMEFSYSDQVTAFDSLRYALLEERERIIKANCVHIDDTKALIEGLSYGNQLISGNQSNQLAAMPEKARY